MRAFVIALCVAISAPSWGSAAQDERARALYEEGKAQFNAEHYPDAYEKFRQAYALSALAPLLWQDRSSRPGSPRTNRPSAR
jgi:outer membrane protein assembly factor BamD (BamD/ComL family)